VTIWPVSYREATLADHSAITELRMSVVENVVTDPPTATHAGFVAFVTKVGKGWVAELNCEVIGFSMVNRSGLIWALFLLPGFEGRGIGKTFLKFLH
jgi:hypothetical protein